MTTREEIKSVVKGDARSDRLTTLRKNNEEVLRKQLKNEAIAKCNWAFRDFAECSKAEGLAVVFKCREVNEIMGKCMSDHYNEEVFQKYAAERGYKAAPKEGIMDRIKSAIAN